MGLIRVVAKSFGVVGGGPDHGYVVFDPQLDKKDDEVDLDQRYPQVNDTALRIARDRDLVADLEGDDLDRELEHVGLPANPKAAEGALVDGYIGSPASVAFNTAVQEGVSQALAALGINADTVEQLKRLDIASRIAGGSPSLDTISTTAHQREKVSGHDGSAMEPPIEEQDTPAGGNGEDSLAGGNGADTIEGGNGADTVDAATGTGGRAKRGS